MINLLEVSVRISTRTILEIDHLSIVEGERVAIIGPNGAGKSTLIRLLAGLILPSDGHIDVLGYDLTQGTHTLPAKQQRGFRTQCGLLMQNLPLVGRLSVLENVMTGALSDRTSLRLWRSLVRLYPTSLTERATRQLSRLGIERLMNTRADRLSGGERQKVALARLSMQRARLILADEPTSALDPVSTLQACEFLTELAHKATMVIVVHDLGLLHAVADRVIGVAQSRLAFDLPVAQISTQMLTNLYGDTPRQSKFSQVHLYTPHHVPLFYSPKATLQPAWSQKLAPGPWSRSK